jgi:hypothetical protein
MYDLACSFTNCQRCVSKSEGIARVNKRICNFQCESSQGLFNVSGLLEWKELGLIDAISCVTDAYVTIE